jgi:hypothetical protein
VNTPDLPVSYRRNADLFEIGFCFFLLPAMVATMDKPPFYLGGKILLWLGAWFLVRRLTDSERARVLDGLQVFRKPLAAILAIAAVAVAGAVLAATSGLDRFTALEPALRWASGAVLLPLFATLISLPVVVLAWAYAPVRFEGAVWFPRWFVAALPVLIFAGLHLASAGWKAPLLALVAGSLAMALGKRIPLTSWIAVHALVGWMGSVGGVW